MVRPGQEFQRALYDTLPGTSLVAGFAASVIAGLDLGGKHRVDLIARPLVSALLSQQFAWFEVYQLREQGRIDIDGLA
ncbi:MAG: hypothetical protein EPO10_22345 [Reyranella sp.]|nr:MAG: hypothetical protein EPO10_22345 [Reyranella sp.]